MARKGSLLWQNNLKAALRRLAKRGTMNRSILAATTLALAACGGSGIGPGGTIGSSNGCSITLSGAVTGTFDCKTAVVAWDSAKNEGFYAFSVAEAGATPQIAVAISFPGEPHSGTYASSGTGVTGAIIVSTSSSSNLWEASKDSTSAQGTYSLKFTGVSTTYSTASGKAYNTAGSLDATMPAASGSAATGTVTAHVTF